MILSSSPKDDFTNFLSKNAVWIAVTIVVIILVTVFLILFLNRKKKNRINKTEDNKGISSSEWLEALGNKENIISVSATGSRLTLSLKDPNKMDVTRLKEFGVKNFISMKEKNVLVISNAEHIVELINKD